MFAAATPVSVRIKLFMATPDTLRKCKVPNPADGTVKVKVSPTETQLLAGQPTGSRIIMRGSMLSACAATAHTAITRPSTHAFIEVLTPRLLSTFLSDAVTGAQSGARHGGDLSMTAKTPVS